ncbi:Ubiquitin carboxyl-terminal hydrolase 36 [Frankliniella fusca]|uniref:Ubiquitin carboxyl-terminal hydrolase 36 n=1 Tax=Frankliniella fusca TaxID=407009 RepID=A0AAE1GTC4_9NEOP|nr:Ubiquitin carboxyl-terminal hydrolase 36 [Frankliniella fusca]
MSKSRPLLGFRNLGNTCFVNAALQVLFSCNLVVQRLLSHTRECRRRNVCVACAVAIDYKNTIRFEPSHEVHAPAPDATLKFLQTYAGHDGVGTQQDSHAFLVSLLNAMNQGLADRRLKMGERMFVTVCRNCQYPREEADPFWDIAVQVRGTVEESLDEYFATEHCDDMINCRFCHQLSPVTRSTKLRAPPEVLIVLMSRFESIDRGSGTRRNESRTHFTSELDLGRHRATNSPARAEDKMRCVGAVVHTGQTLLQGHYRAVAVTTPSQKFHLFDDSEVSKLTSLQALVRNDVYFAVYERASEATAESTREVQPQPVSPPSFFAPRAAATSTPLTIPVTLLTDQIRPLPAQWPAPLATSTPGPEPVAVSDPLPALPDSGPEQATSPRSPFRRFTLTHSVRQYEKRTSTITEPQGGPLTEPSTSSGRSQEVIRSYAVPRQRSSSTSSTTGRRLEVVDRLETTATSPPHASFAMGDSQLSQSTPRGRSPPLALAAAGPLPITTPPQLRLLPRRAPTLSPLASPSPPKPSLPVPFTPSPVQTCAPKPVSKWYSPSPSRSDPGASALRSLCRPSFTAISLRGGWSDSSEDEACDRLPAPTSCHEPLPTRNFPCRHCCLKKKDKRALWRHELRHSLLVLHDKRNYACRFCPEKFRDIDKLHSHARLHFAASESGDHQSMLKCPQKSCGLLFRNPVRLARHRRAHALDGEQHEANDTRHKKKKRSPHQCRTCKENFKNCRDLRRHRNALGLKCRQENCKKCLRRREERKKLNDLKERIEPWEAYKKSIVKLWWLNNCRPAIPRLGNQSEHEFRRLANRIE